jgi:hypothetical protein
LNKLSYYINRENFLDYFEIISKFLEKLEVLESKITPKFYLKITIKYINMFFSPIIQRIIGFDEFDMIYLLH